MHRAAGICLASLSLALWACGGDDPGGSGQAAPPSAFDTRRAFADVVAQVRIGPRPAGSPGSRREVALIVRRLHAAGLQRVVVQRPHRNVVARIPGEEPETVVLGAHHDTKDGIPGFDGANDGASGVAVLLELARVLPNPYPGPAITFAFFDAEEARGDRPFAENGARGSRQFVSLAAAGGRQGSPPLGSIRALYVADLVGDCDLDLPREANSDPGLYGRLRGPSFGGEAPPVLDDHVPFLEAGVPAVDVIDFEFGPGPRPGTWWHTRADTIDKVCPASLGEVGRALVGALGTL